MALVGGGERVRRSIKGSVSSGADAGLRWFVGHDRIDDDVLCDRYGLDGVLTVDADGRGVLLTCERAEREAAWYDWGQNRPISYASVFPGRLDPMQVTLGEIDAGDAGTVETITRAACVLSRHPARLDDVEADHDLAGRWRPTPIWVMSSDARPWLSWRRETCCPGAPRRPRAGLRRGHDSAIPGRLRGTIGLSRG